MKSKHIRPHGTRNTSAMGNFFPSRILISLSGLSLLLLTGTSHGAGLTASDGAVGDQFGYSVSQSGSIGLVGAYQDDIGANTNQGSANIFRALDTATGTVTQNVKLTASDGAAEDEFGRAVSQSGSIGLVGAHADDIGANYNQGSAYIFRGLDTATGAITQNVKLTASGGAASDIFGFSVSLSGSSGLVGAPGTNGYQGSAYGFRSLDTATGTITQNVKLTASDSEWSDSFGSSVSQSGSIGLVGATFGNGAIADQGAAYVFRNLDTATGTITQNVKLIASDGAASDYFGSSVSQSGSNALVGAFVDTIGANSGQGSAYIFRNLDTATGTITQNVKLIASDGAASDYFGSSVSLSGGIGLIGAYQDAFGANSEQGSAYVFRNLDTATGTITQNVKLTASDGEAYNSFGRSVSLDGDQFTIGAYYRNSGTGKAYSGSVSSITTLDTGNTSKSISGISFTSQDDWIIGDTTDANQVTLSSGDSANVTASSKAVFIGKNAGADNNTLIVAGSLTANQITIGAAGNTGNTLQIGTGGSTGTLSAASVITNNGSLIFNRSGTITQGTDFGSAAITGTGSVTQAGPGTTVFNAANSYTGGTIVKSGTLQVGAGGSISHSGIEAKVGNTSGDNGTLSITGGSVTDAYTILGNIAGSTGTLNLSSGTLSSGTEVRVGFGGSGILNMSGGSLTSNYGSLGYYSGSSGTATVSGGTWTMPAGGALLVGESGSGTLTISGGTISGGLGIVGAYSGSHGAASITSGAWSNSQNLIVGYQSTSSGTLNLQGGSVTSQSGFLGQNATSNGSATVSGGSWTNSNTLNVGYSGTGSLSISGGTVSSQSTFVGLNNGSLGTLTLTGGTYSANGGSGYVNLGYYTGSTGTLNIGTGGTAGTLNAAGVQGLSGAATVNFNHTGNVTFAPRLIGSLSVNKLGTGTTTLTGNNTYTGATTVSNGSLVINGAVASTSVVVDGKLSGSGVMANATLSGAGSINPGNSPGVMTVSAVNPTAGLDFYFEFTAADTQPTWNAPTASGNDVLRLTTITTPFTASLSAANEVNIYLNAGALTPGEVFTGGFYTDSNSAFLSSISSGTFTYLVASVGGAILYNGTNYDVYSGPLTFSLATVFQPANFGAGVVNGYTTQFTVIPEPGTCTLMGLGLSALLIRRRSKPESEKS